jgi:hypothetical protein
MLHTGKHHLKILLAAQEVSRWTNAAYWEISPKRLLAAQDKGGGQMLQTGKYHLKRLLSAQEIRRWSKLHTGKYHLKRLLAAQEVRRSSNAADWEISP